MMSVSFSRGQTKKNLSIFSYKKRESKAPGRRVDSKKRERCLGMIMASRKWTFGERYWKEDWTW